MRPALRDVSRRWIAGFRALAERALAGAGADDPAVAARLFVAGVDGLLLAGFASGETPETGTLRDDLERLLVGLT